MPACSFRQFIVPVLLAAWTAIAHWATAQGGSGQHVNYSRDIRPILSNSCYKCHGPDEGGRKAGLRLDTRAGAIAKLESGETAIVPGASAKSAMYQRLTSHDPDVKMPPADSGKSVSPEQIALIKQWIDEGAEFHPHWSFIPPQHRPAPPVKAPERAQNPIDRFILARLEEEGLAPSPEADKTTLVRRATLDLTGLPPTIGEVDKFLADRSPDAYEKLVDRLLASPQYGEQMARYWLDAARYGDTHGLHLDNERSIWPYRDWVIRAFNANKPFDQFAVEQLAGDLLPHATTQQRVATGFNRCNITTGEGGAIDEEFYVRYAVDRVQTTGTVFLGLTLGCCVCHDHKFDPITQKEFYRFFGYFGSLTERPMDGNALLPPPSVRVASSAESKKIERLQKKVAAAESAIRAALRRFRYHEPAAGSPPAANRLTSIRAWEVAAVKEQQALPRNVSRVLAVPAEKRTRRQAQALRDYYVENVFAGSRSVFDPLNAKRDEARRRLEEEEKLSPSTLVMQDLPKPRDIFVLVRGAYDRKGEKVLPGVPAAIGPALPPDAPQNRLSLARWIVDTRNPLTARVIVNRFWQHYFGTGIVKTAEDFGAQGEWPTHPELLDWLATELEQSGWNVKAHAAADCHLGDLSAILARHAGARRAGSRKPASRTRSAIPHGRRNGSRYGTGSQRFARHTGGWQERQAVSATRLVGSDRL